jgi:outer membrane protein OmpU
MNKLKKIGLTALGTSLVASSAIAADATVTGNTGYTWSSEEVGTSTTDGIGFEADFNMSVSGEMDNGWTATGSLLITESAALSSSFTSLTMGSMGTVLVGSGYGGVGQAYDDVTPRAYEENHDGMKTVTAIDSIGASMGNGQIMYMSPSFDLAGMSASFMAEYAPEASNAAVTDGGVSTSSNLWSSGQGLGIKLSGMGISAGAYAQEKTADASDQTISGDSMNATWHVSYSAGPVSIGYQTGGADNAFVVGTDSATRTTRAAGAEAATTAKAYTTAGGIFEYEKMSIAANVSDNMSISWGELKETYDAQSAAGSVADVEMKSTSIQFAYSMGSMSIKGYMTDTDNPGWDSDAKSDEVTELAVGFSF